MVSLLRIRDNLRRNSICVLSIDLPPLSENGEIQNQKVLGFLGIERMKWNCRPTKVNSGDMILIVGQAEGPKSCCDHAFARQFDNERLSDIPTIHP